MGTNELRKVLKEPQVAETWLLFRNLQLEAVFHHWRDEVKHSNIFINIHSKYIPVVKKTHSTLHSTVYSSDMLGLIFQFFGIGLASRLTPLATKTMTATIITQTTNQRYHVTLQWLVTLQHFVIFLEFSSMLSNGTQSDQLPPGRNITLGYCILQVRTSQKQRPKEGTNFYPVFSNIDFWWFVAISHYEYLWMLWAKQIHSATRSLFLFNNLLIVTGVRICISWKNIWSTLGTRLFLELSR